MIHTIADFKKNIALKLTKKLESDGFRYFKTKELFQSSNKEGTNKIFIYPTARNNYLSIEIKCFYESNEIKKIFKKVNPDLQNPRLKMGTVGGTLKFIIEKEFNEVWNFSHSTITFDLPNSFDIFLNDFMKLYQEYIVVFFDKCRDSKYIHSLLNTYDANSVGFGINYENRVLKGLPAAINSGISLSEFSGLSEKYESALRNDSLNYLENYLTIKDTLLKQLKKEN